ncbi:ABC transporter permease [Azotosporobacter soli]|uniref:ABC transporter permease n=1 Tax=Azotosporobacter soli TaxID=3055040 RepID=UPI0031FEC1A9
MFRESILIAWEGLKSNKLRSLLTMLGIIVGVAAVVAMVSIGLGVQKKVQSSIASLGSNLLIVMPGANSPSGGVRLAAGSNITLTNQDAKAITREISGVEAVAPTVSQQCRLVYGNQNWKTSVQGATPEFFALRNYSLAVGASFSSSDETMRNRVAVIGQTVAENLFGNASPVGQMIRVDNAPFRVIGVLAAKGQSSMGQDQDDLVVIPLTTGQERLMGINYVHSISIQVTESGEIERVQEEIAQLIRTRHHIAANAENDFTVRNMTALMATMQENTATITLFLAAVAAIALLVGGIGVMNIMLVSVTERTREIGIRKALGASYGNILLQFLAEAIVISVSGGIIGILCGSAASYIVSAVAGWTTVLSYHAIISAFSLTIGIGLFFGIYPARKAALLDPIDALRYE